MKAERRHELQENTLAHVLSNFPLYLSVYGGRVLLVLSLCVLAFVLLRFRSQTKTAQFEQSRASLATARDAVFQLSQMGIGMAPPAAIAEQRGLLINDANTQLDYTTANADTDAVKAEAAITRGDLYWAIANLPDLPGSSTQPALSLPEPRTEALDKSAAAYEDALKMNPSAGLTRGTAMLGLGAIAENRGDFAAARQRYEQIRDSDLPEVIKSLAVERLTLLPIISKPRRIATATQPSTLLPDTVAAPVEATTQPTTRPTP